MALPLSVGRGAAWAAGAACLLLLASWVVAMPPAGGHPLPVGSATSRSGFNTPFNVSVPNAIDPVNPAAIPIGDGQVSTSAPGAGWVYSCQVTQGGGVEPALPWVNTTSDTWNASAKAKVRGDVGWPAAQFVASVSGAQRVITGNDLPLDHTTGVFPVNPNDPSYQYDANPNAIESQDFRVAVPLQPVNASRPSCLPMGPIAVLSDGIFLFNALDELGRDALVHEVLDAQCDGHPDSHDTYHHHDIPSCIMIKAVGNDTATLVGYAFDGFGIYVERDRNGTLLTDANLDECHGRTSEVLWNGEPTVMYHYVATLEYPYTVGCFRGTPVSVELTAPNTPSGLTGPVVYTIGGVALIALVAAVLLIRRRRRAARREPGLPGSRKGSSPSEPPRYGPP